MANGATRAQTRADRLLRARIAGQAGLLTRSQALEAGWTAGAIRWQVTSGRWHLVHRGVYLTTPGRADWEVRAVAGLLAVGAPSCLRGASAGVAWGLQAETDSDVQLLVPVGRNGRDLPGITVARTRRFSERVHPSAWPHRTTAEHTIFDLALGHGADRAIALMAKGCQLRITSEESLVATLESRSTQPHRRILLEALGLVGAGAESAAEVRYIRDVEQAHGLPTGGRQEPGPGSRARDTAYDDVRVIVEIDGRLGHVGWGNQQRAGLRDRKSAVGGWLTVRCGWTDVAVTPCEFAGDLAAIFRARGWKGCASQCGRPGCELGKRAA